MKYLFLVFSILLLTINNYAQQAFVNEGFEEGMPSDWTVYNEDGDSNEWEIINMSFWAMTGNKAISLQTTTGANDWLVSSQVFLQEAYFFSFWATEIVENNEENITVWLSTTGNLLPDFTVNLSDIIVPYLGFYDNGFLYTEYRIDLSVYQGQNVYIAWQLTSPTENGICLIDNITTQYTAENIGWSNISSGFYNRCIQTTSDAGYITSGAYNNDLFIQKYNSSGAIEWTTFTNGGYDGDSGHDIVETFDNQDNPSGYVVAGEKGTGVSFSCLIWICKYDTEGGLEWTYEYGNSAVQNEANSIKQTNDGGYIITGYLMAGNYHFFLLKLDNGGNQEWIEIYGNSETDLANDVVQTADGGYALTGFSREAGGQYGEIFILKTDKDGNEEFWTKYPDTDFARADAFYYTSDGGFVLAAFNQENSRDWRIIKTDNEGIMEWEYTNGGAEEDIPFSIQQTAEGNFIVAGVKTVNEKERMWIVKLDANGQLIWETEYETAVGQSRIKEIQQSIDGGYIFAGPTTSFSDNLDGLIIKIEQGETDISQNDILNFYLAEQTGDAIIDTDNHTITVSVSDETNISALIPTIYTSPQSKIFPKSATTQNFTEDFIYTVTALDQTQQDWTVTVEGGYVSVIEKMDADFRVWPNPSNGIFTIKTLQKFQALELKITDITGKTFYTRGHVPLDNPLQIDLSNHPKGIYFMTIKTGKEIFSEKLIIQ